MKYFQKTDSDDLDVIVKLVNSAYRGIEGSRRWTTEAHLVQGDRLVLEDLRRLIRSQDTEFYVGYLDENLISCIAIKKYGAITEFGTFAVDPNLHGLGYGKDLLSFAESKASTYSSIFQVTVVSQNSDLVRFYQRRGYKVTGQRLAYPTEQNVGKPKIKNIDLTVLQKKRITSCSSRRRYAPRLNSSVRPH